MVATVSQRTWVAGWSTVVFLVVGSATAYAVGATRSTPHAQDGAAAAAPTGDVRPAAGATRGPRILFRHTGVDDDYGKVASVPLDDPDGARAFGDVSCDRVYATTSAISCLRTDLDGSTTSELSEYDAGWRLIQRVPLGGVPSRTRLSPDGTLVSTTVFVKGHAYQQTGYSTDTEIRDVGGRERGDLEDYTLVIDGRQVAPADRNVWGVTFADDDNTFYASVGTGGRTYLVRGDLDARSLTSVAEHVECPSLSPDGRRIAFKQASERGGTTWWTPAVLDLATGRRTVLGAETRNVDDQLEWLDEHTVLYGLPREDHAGVTDVWALDTRGGAQPRLFIQNAWSPAVVRP